MMGAMATRTRESEAGFEAAFRTLLGQKREEAEDVDQAGKVDHADDPAVERVGDRWREAAASGSRS